LFAFRQKADQKYRLVKSVGRIFNFVDHKT